MKNFDDQIHAHDFDDFQFINFTEIMSKSTSLAEKEAVFSIDTELNCLCFLGAAFASIGTNLVRVSF